MLRSSGAFTFSEINELVDAGCLNGLFVLARSTGFIGHYLDQKRSDASGKSQWRVATRLGPAQHDDRSNNGSRRHLFHHGPQRVRRWTRVATRPGLAQHNRVNEVGANTIYYNAVTSAREDGRERLCTCFPGGFRLWFLFRQYRAKITRTDNSHGPCSARW